MLSYRHSFHAGNHADVLKHTVQSLIIESLKEKEKPFLYLDTHAGRRRYQLSSEHAERTGNISKASPASGSRMTCPPSWSRISPSFSTSNRSGQLRYYPGSPLIAASCCASRTAADDRTASQRFSLLRASFRKTTAPGLKKPMAISS